MRRPSFQFYPADWRSNAKLGRCSRAERGDWIELICLLHDSEEYGVLRWPLEDIAKAIGCQVADLRRGLITKAVLKGADVGERCKPFVYVPRHAGKDGPPVTLIPEDDGPVWYSSRMVRDEYIRTNRAAQGQPEAPPKGDIGEHQSRAPARAPAQSSSASSSPSGKEQSTPLSGEAPDDTRAGEQGAKEKAKRDTRAAAERVIAYLNEKAGTRFKAVKANVRLPVARILYDGATEEDLRAVVDLKVAESAKGEFDRKYLRPATLWNAEKFSQYIGQVTVQPPTAAKRDESVKVYAENDAGVQQLVTDSPAGKAEDIARKVFAEYGGVPWMRGTRNLIVRANGTESRFSVDEIRCASDDVPARTLLSSPRRGANSAPAEPRKPRNEPTSEDLRFALEMLEARELPKEFANIWARYIAEMRIVDRRSHEEMRSLFLFAMGDKTFRTLMSGPGEFRNRWDELRAAQRRASASRTADS